MPHLRRHPPLARNHPLVVRRPPPPRSLLRHCLPPPHSHRPRRRPRPPPSAAQCFASAHVEPMPFPLALDAIYSSDLDSKFVAYAQQQNDCFRSEYAAIGGDCEPHIEWASEALGCLPEAVNLWIGNQLSETSFHKDHYENLYAVVTGEKHFLLLPPTDVHRMYIRNYPAAHYSYSKYTGEFKLELEDPVRYVPWCSVNPYPSPENREKEMSKFPLYFDGPKPFEVTVKAGEILYFPKADKFKYHYAINCLTKAN
ncbi:2-oxoglutarate (2OG) and Fe(II)-dependent oxygenase superfamily protein [Actinidia rufa]|uniref:2-oxoglutarate (2OG) and Fe(II)-dependent oxygenase superfamily protein n=1 Tax=Actinidia rufa TaxID=165716 RepID=A0A7J0GZP2_9ERIC|nr:2-oxoglutarate (2OG) and Fe(II)-dependent oxygenase superfamily protein [Actinidia rufa]